MKVDSIFLGSADRERAQRYAGITAEDENEGSDEDEDDDAGETSKFPITAKRPKKIKDDDSENTSDEEERAYMEDVNR